MSQAGEGTESRRKPVDQTTSTPASTCSTPQRRARHTTGSAPRCTIVAGDGTARPPVRAHEQRVGPRGFGFGLDCECQAGGGDRDGVDVPAPAPRQRVAQPPALRLEPHERSLTSSSERAPTRLRPASTSQCRAKRPRPIASSSRRPAIDVAPMLASQRPSIATAAAPAATAQPATAVGIAGGVGSSRDHLQTRESKHEVILAPLEDAKDQVRSTARFGVAVPSTHGIRTGRQTVAVRAPPAARSAASLIHLLAVRAKRGICGHERTHRDGRTTQCRETKLICRHLREAL